MRKIVLRNTDSHKKGKVVIEWSSVLITSAQCPYLRSESQLYYSDLHRFLAGQRTVTKCNYSVLLLLCHPSQIGDYPDRGFRWLRAASSRMWSP